VVLILLIPLPLFFAQTVYGTAGFTTWVAFGIAWAFIAAIIVVIYPVWESRVALGEVLVGIVKV